MLNLNQRKPQPTGWRRWRKALVASALGLFVIRCVVTFVVFTAFAVTLVELWKVFMHWVWFVLWLDVQINKFVLGLFS